MGQNPGSLTPHTKNLLKETTIRWSLSQKEYPRFWPRAIFTDICKIRWVFGSIDIDHISPQQDLFVGKEVHAIAMQDFSPDKFRLPRNQRKNQWNLSNMDT